MRYRAVLLFCLLSIFHFNCTSGPIRHNREFINHNYKKIQEIPAPAGYSRVAGTDSSFAAWLRHITLKESQTVYLYNGQPKPNQGAQYAIMDISVGKKDLQQCADAVMRLRAEYLYTHQRWSEIAFLASNGQELSFPRWMAGERYRLSGNKLQAYHTTAVMGNRRKQFDEFLEFVFVYAGTYSLQQQLKRVDHLSDIRPGDVFVKGGSPGHAMLVVDVAADASGKKKFLLAQSYMPAQDIHIVINPGSEPDSPWYDAEEAGNIVTPEWVFDKRQLYRW